MTHFSISFNSFFIRMLVLSIMLSIINLPVYSEDDTRLIYTEDFSITDSVLYNFRAVQKEGSYNFTIERKTPSKDPKYNGKKEEFSLVKLDENNFITAFFIAMKNMGVEEEIKSVTKDINKTSTIDMINGLTVKSVNNSSRELFDKVMKAERGENPNAPVAGYLTIKDNGITVYPYSNYIGFVGFSKSELLKIIVQTHKKIREKLDSAMFKNRDTLEKELPNLFNGEADILHRLNKHQYCRLIKQIRPNNYEDYLYFYYVFSRPNNDMIHLDNKQYLYKKIVPANNSKDLTLVSKFNENKKYSCKFILNKMILKDEDFTITKEINNKKRIKVRKPNRVLIMKLEALQETLAKLEGTIEVNRKFKFFQIKIRELDTLLKNNKKELGSVYTRKQELNNSYIKENNKLDSSKRKYLDAITELSEIKRNIKEEEKRLNNEQKNYNEQISKITKQKKNNEIIKEKINNEIELIKYKIIENTNKFPIDTNSLHLKKDSLEKVENTNKDLIKLKDKQLKDINNMISLNQNKIKAILKRLTNNESLIIQNRNYLDNLKSDSLALIERIKSRDKGFQKFLKTYAENVDQLRKDSIRLTQDSTNLVKKKTELTDDGKKISPEQLQVKEIQLEFQEGNLKNVEVFGTYKGEEHRFVNLTPISFSSLTDFNYSASLHSFNYRRPPENYKFRIYLGNIINYKAVFYNYSEDYSPKDMVLRLNADSLKSKKQWILTKPEVDKLLDARIYTDLIGLGGNNPNGLVQTEVSRKIILRPRRTVWPYLNRHLIYYGYLNYVEPVVSINKLEDSNKEIVLGENPDNKNLKTVKTLELLRYSNFNFGVKINAFVIDYAQVKSSIFFNFGTQLVRTAVRDDSTTKQDDKNFNVNSLFSYFELKWQIKQDHRFGFSISPRIGYMDLMSDKVAKETLIRQESTPEEKKLNNYWLYSVHVDASLNLYNSSKLFFRGIYNTMVADLSKNFFQVQLGVAFDILKRRQNLTSTAN